MSLMLRFVRCSPSGLIHESLVSSTAATELPHPEGRSTDALVNDRIHCLVYLPFALQFTICSVPYHCIAVLLVSQIIGLYRFFTVFHPPYSIHNSRELRLPQTYSVM